MAEYKLQVTTGDLKYASTNDHIYATLFGTEGQSERTKLDNIGRDFGTGTVSWIQSYVITLKLCDHFNSVV